MKCTHCDVEASTFIFNKGWVCLNCGSSFDEGSGPVKSLPHKDKVQADVNDKMQVYDMLDKVLEKTSFPKHATAMPKFSDIDIAPLETKDNVYKKGSCYIGTIREKHADYFVITIGDKSMVCWNQEIRKVGR